MPITQALGMLKDENHSFKVHMGYVSEYLKKDKTETTKICMPVL